MVNPRDIAGKHRRRRIERIKVTFTKISPKVVNPKDKAGKMEEEEE